MRSTLITLLMLLAGTTLQPASMHAQGTWDEPAPGIETTEGEAQSTASEDTVSRDTASGDTASGDTASGDTASGDTASGDTAPAVDPAAAGTAAGSAPVRTQFALAASRPIAFRMRPNAGFRLPERTPAFSPQPPDYFGEHRQGGGQFALTASFDVIGESGAEGSGKAQEFRDLDDGVAVGIDAFLRNRRNYLRLTGRHLGLRDQDAKLEWRRPGLFVARADYSQIPHNYVFGATSLYDGVGSGVLTIPDEVQASLQGSTGLVDAAARARAAIDAFGHGVDLRHRRDRSGLRVDIVPTEAFALSFQLKDESRVGTRPWSASFGLASAVEIPWPVDYDTEDVRVGFEYFGTAKGFLVSGEYRRQTFENNTSNVLFDNPWRLVDSSVGNAIVQSFASGPATGLIDLYPNNEHDQLTLTAIKRNLPKDTTIMATVSWGDSEQNDNLLPFTTNTAVVPGATANPPFDFSDPANRPRQRAEAALETRLVHLRVTSRPTKHFDLRAQVRDYQLDNETAQIFIPGFVPEDTQFRPANTPSGLTNLPIAHGETTSELEFGFRLPRRTKLTLGVTRQDMDRSFREVEESTEDTYKISFDAKPATWVDLRASFLVAERDVEAYVFDQFFTAQDIQSIPALPFLRKFDQASRDRDRLQLLANFYPHESLMLSTQLIVGSDDYDESRFGVLGDDHRIVSFDVSWTASQRVSLYASWSVEDNDVSLQGREWFPGAVSDPFTNSPGLDDPSNWRAASKDEIDTIGFGLEAELIPDRLRFELAFTWSETNGRIDYQSPLGDRSVDLNAFVPAPFEEVDDVRFFNLNPELEYTVGERLSLTFAYMRERYDIDDFNLDGFTLVPVDTAGAFNGAIFMGTQFTDFDFDLWAVRLKVRY